MSREAEDLGLTHSQQQIWIGQSLHPESPLYNMAFAFVLPVELDLELFCEAWQQVAVASDALRTRVVDPRGGEPRVGLDQAPETTVVDLEKSPVSDGAFRRWCRERCAKPLAVDGPLVDSVLVPLDGGRTGWYLNQHHLVSDAWSTRLLYREVAAAYESLLAGSGESSSTLPDYYSTATALQSTTDAPRSAREHWALRREGPGRTVAFYGRTPGGLETPSTRRTLDLGADRCRALDRLCEEQGFRSPIRELSRFAVLAALLSSWLHRISGQEALGFDAPVSGRPTADAKKSLGLFIEMHPFAVHVDPNDSFRAVGARCLEESIQFARHALPGLSAPSEASASNVVLNYVPLSFGEFAGARPEVEWVHPGHGDSVHALRVQAHEFAGEGRLVLHFDFNDGALPESMQRRSMEHFDNLLDAVLENPDRSIGEIDILVDDERRALAALNATEHHPLAERTVVASFQAQADRTPDEVALREGADELSFAALRGQTEALATVLAGAGVEPGDRVAITGRRSIEAVVAVLGTLTARAAFVPIDRSLPTARVEQMLRDSGARLVLTSDDPQTVPSAGGLQVLSVSEAIAGGTGAPFDDGPPELDEPAYVIYTSGSTGVPKGVLVEHRGLANYLAWASRRYVRGDRLSFPLFTSMAFDLTLTSLFLPLLTGGTLVIYPEPEGPVDTALMDVALDDLVDFIKLTPSHLAVLARMGLEGSRVRRMVVGGENLTTALAASVSAQLHDQLELVNEYGPTEAVVGCVAHLFDRQRDTAASVPIGTPIEHAGVEILNPSMSPVPIGVPGELWVSRPGLARGYLGLEELTAESFQPHPHRPSRRRYRTGDLVRITEAGVLEYLGRIDRQLKVAGYRVEPGEVEAALMSLPMVDECAVLARRSRPSAPSASGPVSRCTRCGLPSNYPRAVVNDDGVCSVCRSYEAIKGHAQEYFRNMDDLRAIFAESAERHHPKYDCMMLYSGGKDSSYALCRLVEMGLSVYAFTLDNGFISEGAKDNIRRVTEQLGVPVEFATSPAMNDIFRDSLTRFSNVCNGCFKTIYTLSMGRARELEIPIIVTGLSRGQMFETRLTEEMFRDGRCSPDEVDAAVLAARKVYHRVPDEATRRLDVSIFENDRIFDEVRFVDFYRYCDVGLDEVFSHLERAVPWVRPQDTGRSTNCLINDVGIYIHNKERGYHNYALPYSWDVRLGHKTRDGALEELDDDIDLERVREILADIGYDEDRTAADAEHTALEAYVVASEPVTDEAIRELLGERLPPQLIPMHIRQVEAIPLAASGKVDEQALRAEAAERLSEAPYRAPEGPVAEYLAGLWQEELGVERVGAGDSFFELGGTSLTAMQVMLQLCQEFNIELPLETLFSHPTLEGLARAAEDRILADVAAMPDEERRRLLDSP